MKNNTLKKISEYLSFPTNLREEKLSNKQIYIQEDLSKYLKKKKNKEILKTHKIFSSEVFNIIKQKKLKNFLRLNFIQKMFFIHNRFYLIPHLIKILFSPKNYKIKRLLKEDLIGNPVPFFLFRKTSGNRIRCTYHIKKFIDFCILHKSKLDYDILFEVGGGYGCFARIFKIFKPKTKVIIFDTLEVTALQSYYLKSLNYSVSVNSCSGNICLFNDIIKLDKILKKLKNKKILFVSTWAISEMPIKVRECFFKELDYFSGYIIAFQSKFEKINNCKFFLEFKEKLNFIFYNKIIPIKAMNFMNFNVKHFYLLAIKKK